MGGSGMNATLSTYVKKNFPDSKSDLSTCFMEQCERLATKNGCYAMINIPVWMFLSSYEKLRKKIEVGNTYINMVHFGRGIFGSDFGTTSFVISKKHTNEYTGVYRRLFEKQGAVDSVEQKQKWFFEGMGYYTAKQENFSKIPGSPIAYWVSENFVRAFERGISIDSISDFTGSQHKTADNEKYLRMFWEIEKSSINNRNWIFYIKGGNYRKWYGNIDLVVDWSKSAKHFYKNNPTSNMIKEKYWYQEGITYTSLTSSTNTFRYLPPIGVFDIKGPSLTNVKNMYYCLGLLNSKVSVIFYKTFNATMTLQVKDVKNIPIIIDNLSKSTVSDIVKENVDMCKKDWDSFETSWDFERHPLV